MTSGSSPAEGPGPLPRGAEPVPPTHGTGSASDGGTTETLPETLPENLPAHLPDGARQVRTTPVFDETSVPTGLLAAHQLAVGVWARVQVQQGSLDFVFEDAPARPIRVDESRSLVVPPQRPHHVVLTGPVRFILELYR